MSLQRLQRTAKRWPGLCLALLLVSSVSQSLAASIDWCLHQGEVHVVSSVVPCEEMKAPIGAPCHGAAAHDAAAAAQRMHHVAAGSDGSVAPGMAGNALPVAALGQFSPRVVTLILSDTAAAVAAVRRSHPPPAATRPRVSDAVPGDTSRLLI